MKKIFCLFLGYSCSAFALEQNPIAPPSVEIVDKFGVNMQSAQLARSLNTVSIGGELGLSHHVQLYTDLFADGTYFGYVDAFAGTVTRKNISQNSVQIMTNANGDATFFRDSGQFDLVSSDMVSVMRAYGPAGSQDFLVYQNGVLNRDASATTGLSFKAVGDVRHTLTQSADQSYFTWTTPDGTESKYASYGNRLIEVTYPNGFKVRVSYYGVATNTGFMLKYQLNNQGLSGTPDQIVAINRANQYCSPDATTACATTGWPTATFTWPVGTPSNFWTPSIPLTNYLVKLTTPAGVTEIQYQPDDLCWTNHNNEDTYCDGHTSGLGHWSPRLHSIKTPESTVPNYQYTYTNIGAVVSGSADGYWPYWNLTTRVGQIANATLNGTDTESYAGPIINQGTMRRDSSGNGSNAHVMVTSAQYDLNVINSAWTQKAGSYYYYYDQRHFVEKYFPITGLGPKLHYYYNGPRGNLDQINTISATGTETLLQSAVYATTCVSPKTCNKPLSVTDARGNVTNYEYDPQGRFGNPTKITAPADKNGLSAATVFNYTALYAFYKKDSDAIAQDPDPVWLLSSKYTCQKSNVSGAGCANGNLDMVKTDYYYGPQNSSQANNLLLRGQSVTAESNGSLVTRVTCYEYDKYGKLIGETSPKGNSSNLQSCQ